MTAGEDAATLAFYEAEAAAYAQRGRQAPNRRLPEFLAALPPGARILELGCGGGRDARAMIDAGFEVEPTDGCAALAAEAEALIGRPVRVMRFSELVAEARYAGVWASASLLHVPRRDLPGVLARVHRALVPGGLFIASYKAGAGEGRDRFGRYFNYPDEAWLGAAYAEAGAWRSLALERGRGSGYDGVETDWLAASAVR